MTWQCILIGTDAPKTHGTLISNEPSTTATTAWPAHFHAVVIQARRSPPPPGRPREEMRHARRAPGTLCRLLWAPAASSKGPSPVSRTPGSAHPPSLNPTSLPLSQNLQGLQRNFSCSVKVWCFHLCSIIITQIFLSTYYKSIGQNVQEQPHF